MSVDLKTIASGYSTGLINENFQQIADLLNNNFLNRDGVEPGDANQMELDLDMNGYAVINAGLSQDEGSLVTKGYVDDYNATQDAAIEAATQLPTGDLTELASALVTDDRNSVTRALNSWLGGQVFSYTTLDDALADSNLKVGCVIQTAGYEEALDGGANRYLCVPTGTGVEDGGRFLDHLSSPVQLKGMFPHGVSVKQFGAKGDGVTDDTTALVSAVATGFDISVPKGVYPCTEPLFLDNSQLLLGEGCPEWDFPSHGKDVTFENGTTILFTGTPTTFAYVEAITDSSHSGGCPVNPDADGTSDANYRLTDFTNKDASGATPATLKALKVGVVLDEAYGSRVEHLRVQLDYNGVDGYNDDSLTGLGADWDIGILVKNSSFTALTDVQSVGYWRMLGCAMINAKIGTDLGEGVYNRLKDCYFQGFKGLAFRSPDAFRVNAVGASTIDIAWTESSQVPESGAVWFGTSTRSFTSVTRVGDQLRLNGISTSGISEGSEVRLNRPNVGVAGTVVENCIVTGLFHKSRLVAHSSEIGFTSPSTALEISGHPMRDVDFINTHFFDSDVLMHIHDVEDLGFVGCFWEAAGYRTSVGGSFGPSGARVIITPTQAGNDYGPYPITGASKVVVDSTSEFAASSDLAPYYRPTAMTRFTGSGLCRPGRFLNLAEGLGVGSVPLQATAYDTFTTMVMTGEEGNRGFRLITPSFGYALTATENGRIGINTSSPDSALHVEGASSSITQADDLIVESQNAALQLRAKDSGSAWWRMWTDSGKYLRIGASTGQNSTFSSLVLLNRDIGEMAVDGNIRPIGDNEHSLGLGQARFTTVYATTGTINTSDERDKTEFVDLSEKELNVARKVKSLIKKYKWLTSVEEKGEEARWHFGVGAQSVQEAFESEGLNGFDYGCLCYDEWDEDGVTVGRYGVRADELMFLMMATL